MTKVYDYDMLMGLNHPDLSALDVNLISFFNDLPSYQITKEIRYFYPNKFNIHFNRNRARPKTVVSNDPEITKKLRSNLSKVSDQNIDKMTDRIKELLTQQEDFDWKDISLLFYEIIIQNIFFVNLFVNILKILEPKHPKLIHHIHHLIINQVYHPRTFKDTLSEPGENKAKRWQVSNGLLIAQIYKARKYSQLFMEKILKMWLSRTSPESLVPLEILVKVIPELKKEKGFKLEKSISEKLTAISQDKSYPGRLRLLLTLPSKR